MILVGTSIWIDHFRAGHATVITLLERGLVLAHPWVIGELALGLLSQRREVIGVVVRPAARHGREDRRLLTLIKRHEFYGRGTGYVDAQRLAATRLTPEAALWTKGPTPSRRGRTSRLCGRPDRSRRRRAVARPLGRPATRCPRGRCERSL